MKVAPYLFFDGRAEEAIEFYRRVLNAEVEMMSRFKDSPDAKSGMTPPGAENKIMHASCASAKPFFCCPTGIARASRISAVSELRSASPTMPKRIAGSRH